MEPLPKATAALIELDNLHRAKNPVGPVLAGKLRWAVADAIGCEYSRRCAEADRSSAAGVSDDELPLVTGAWKSLPEADRAVVEFARQLTLAGHEVSDNQVAALIEQFGPEQVVGIVHTVAFANFENRLFLALDVEVEPDGPLPPLELKLDPRQQLEVSVPARRPWEEVLSITTSSDSTARVDWGQQDFSALEMAKSATEPQSENLAPGSVSTRKPAVRYQGTNEEDHLEQRQYRVPAATDRGLVPLDAGIPRRGDAGPRVLQLRVLGGHAEQ